MTSGRLLATSLVAIVILPFGGTADAASTGINVGTLECSVASGWGFVLGSSKALHCTFATDTAQGSERYEGRINKFGVDLGYTARGAIVWLVLAPTSGLAPGALQGEYVGATAGATAGVGLGANVLLGGSNRSITLQPVSFEGNEGLNVAAGIGNISLKYVP